MDMMQTVQQTYIEDLPTDVSSRTTKMLAYYTRAEIVVNVAIASVSILTQSHEMKAHNVKRPSQDPKLPSTFAMLPYRGAEKLRTY